MTTLQASKALRKGVEGYLAYVVDTKETSISLENIPIVKEFLDVFHDELPGITLGREIEFEINLVPEVVPISKAITWWEIYSVECVNLGSTCAFC